MANSNNSVRKDLDGRKPDAPRKTGRAYRRVKTCEKKARRLKISEYSNAVGCNWGYRDGEYVPLKTRAVRRHRSNYSRFLKQFCNRRYRRRGEIFQKGGGYKRVTDYWWRLY